MKKVLAFAVLAVSMSFFACNNNGENATEGSDTDTTVVAPVETAPAATDSSNMNMGADSSNNMGTDTANHGM